MKSKKTKTTKERKPIVCQVNKALSNKQKFKTEAITKKYTLEEIRRSYLATAQDIFSADKKLEDFERRRRVKPSGDKNLKKELVNILTAFELDTHFALAQTTSKKYKTLAVEFCEQIIQEYDCRTSSEKALAEIIAGAFVRQLSCAERLNSAITVDFLNKERNAFMAILSKELSRATRSYITALLTLKQMKSSPVKLNVKATTAFIAQNQQINATNNRSISKNENIKPI